MSTSNHTNTAYTITYSGGFFKITFNAPLSESFYFNRELLNIRVSPLGSVYVDLGQFDWGILTVNYQLATAPTPIFAVGPPIVYITRDQWIAAVIALITTPNVAPTALAAPAITDSLVGYNATTDQWTDLGNIQQQRFRVYSTINQAFVVAGTTAIFNVIVSDPLSIYNAATGIVTIPAGAGGTWIFGMCFQTAIASYGMICVNGTTTTQGKVWSVNNGVGSASTELILAAGDTVRCILYSNNGNMSVVGEICNFWGKRVI